jgi:hypothetical protein
MKLVALLIILATLITDPLCATAAERKTPPKTTWAVYHRDGHCEPLLSLRKQFTELKNVSTPKAVAQSFRDIGWQPTLYPIDDPTKPLKGFTVIDIEHQLSLILLESKSCPHAVDPTELDTASTLTSSNSRITNH